jgi:Raf kinase inhibitor-like YbhB/YbcL family protein
MSSFSIFSDEFIDQGSLGKKHEYNSFGGEGENQSPAFHWANAPSETRSFAITLHDPDAQTGSGFWHWVACGIPAHVTSLPANAGSSDGSLAPTEIVQFVNDYGMSGFGGACPPPGERHRYVFTLHALSVESLGVDASVTNAVARFLIHAHTIETASITAQYQR